MTAVRELAAEEPVGLVVRGRSMLPLIEDGARVEISASGRYLPGDVIAFRRDDGQLSVHRVLGYRPGRGGWRIVTRGDAAGALDPPVDRQRVVGKVVGGDCPPRVSRVPIGDRLTAVARFTAAAVRSLFTR